MAAMSKQSAALEVREICRSTESSVYFADKAEASGSIEGVAIDRAEASNTGKCVDYDNDITDMSMTFNIVVTVL
jgi:hypothetical protein